MNKYLLSLPLLILIQSCATNGIADHRTLGSYSMKPSSYNKYIGELSVNEVPPFRDVPYSELKDRAIQICYSLGGLKNEPYIYTDGVLGYKVYRYQCNGPQYSNPASVTATPVVTKPSVSIDEAKQQCKDLGFKPGTEKFGNCVLELSK
jgi:hypothetical protein